ERPRGGELVALRLMRAQSVVAISPARVGRSKLRALDEVEWINWGRSLAQLPDAQWIDANVPAERIVLRTSSMDAQLHAARAGLGALLLPRAFVRWTQLAELRLGSELEASLPPMPSSDLWLVGHTALRQ